MNSYIFPKSGFHIPKKKKKNILLLQSKSFTNDEKYFMFIPINGLIRKQWLISKLMTHVLNNKELQYTYCPISQEVKAT